MKRLSDCRAYEQNQAAYLDGQLSVDVRRALNAHLEICGRCRERSRGLREVKNTLRTLPKVTPPAHLTTRLRINASLEIARRRDARNWWQIRAERFRVWASTLMRPLALPAAGGVLSAMLMFGTVGPYLVLPSAEASPFDVPTGLYTEPTVNYALPVGLSPEEIEIELTIDEQGRMLDYSIPQAQRDLLERSPSLQRSLENRLLFTTFTPAKFLGQKVPGGKIRLTFRTSSIDVKG